jgi:hypothetical protein
MGKVDVMKYLVYPEGYDPEIAAGPPKPYYLGLGYNWTPEDTKKMRALEDQSTVSDHVVDGRWCVEATCEMCTRHEWEMPSLSDVGDDTVCGVCYCDGNQKACKGFQLRKVNWT